jgi:diaminobutyrate-2-oxoglutarate transaminase
MLAHDLEVEAVRKGKIVQTFLASHLRQIDPSLIFRGIGMMWGIDMKSYPCGTTQNIQKACFEQGLILELSGREDTVVKIMPPLVIDDGQLLKGLNILMKVLAETIQSVDMSPIKPQDMLRQEI